MIAVISDDYWSRAFGRDPSVLGRTITADGHTVSIVGVTAPEFTGLIPGSHPRDHAAAVDSRHHRARLSDDARHLDEPDDGGAGQERGD